MPGTLTLRRTRAPVAVSSVAWVVWLFIPIFIYATIFPFLRAAGVPMLALAVLLAGFIFLMVASRYLERRLLVLAGLGLFYAVLSGLGLLHRNITLMFQPAAIPQQAAYTILLVLLVPCFAYYHEQVGRGRTAYLRLELFVLMLCVLSELLVAGSQGSTEAIGIGQLVNGEAIGLFILVRRLASAQSLSFLGRLLIAIAMLALQSSFQSTIVLCALIGLLALPRHRRAFALTIGTVLLIASILSLIFAEHLWTFDPNTAVRSYFWRDVLARVWHSGGIGIGFGTETLRPEYFAEAQDTVILSADDPGFIYTGAHNAFMDALYRMGVPGFLTLAGYFGHQVRRVLLSGRRPGLLESWLVVTIFVVLMVNVGLASINFLFGTAFLMAWLTAAERVEHEADLAASDEDSSPRGKLAPSGTQ